jgi:hypothetical protein
VAGLANGIARLKGARHSTMGTPSR